MTKKKQEVPKTIRMPKKTLAKWLKALRSGEYKQVMGTLFDEEKVGYCCLGVLQHCLDGGVEHRYYTEEDDIIITSVPEVAPSLEWLKDEGIKFADERGYVATIPFLPTLGVDAATANDGSIDSRQRRFKTIANAIEACTETY